MRKFFAFALFICLCVNADLFAQTGVLQSRKLTDQGDRLLTMEEAVLGYNLYPQNKVYAWRGQQELTYTENNSLKSSTVGKKKNYTSTILTLEELNKNTGLALNAFPNISWEDSNLFAFYSGNSFYKYHIQKRALVVDVPVKGGDFTPAPTSETTLFAYTRDNNLYLCNGLGEEKAVTADSDPNIVNGQSVSRNEFGIDGGIFWSPDAALLAFYRKDESAVTSFPLLDIKTRTGELREIKYPMAGMASEHISLGVYNVETGETLFLKVTDFDEERYLTNITWTPDSRYILIQVLDRSQKHFHLNMYEAATGNFVKTLFTEENDRFIEPLAKLLFLPKTKGNDTDRFLYHTDNRDGYKNLYLCDLNGNVKRLTVTDADVSFVDVKGNYVYYNSAEISPIESHLFRVNLKSGKQERLTTEAGIHRCQVSGNGQWFIDRYSSLCVPNVINLTATNGRHTEELFRAEDPVKEYNYGEIILGTIKSADGRFNNYYRLIKPADFEPAKKYPVVVYVYGGPHSQMVQNSFLGLLRRWEMLMAQKGYVVYVQDNRGTSNQGADFEKAIYGECGQAEMADQMEGIKMLQSLPYVDSERIGVHGWSYGGFMTISLMTNYPDIFKVGVAGGPVIDWKWYEVMYGERYMGSPLTNAEGYEKVALVQKAKDLKGKLLICQGAIDNTVVWQHSLSFINACIESLIQVDYFPYPCHEHNVRGRDRIHLMDKVTLYFDTWL